MSGGVAPEGGDSGAGDPGAAPEPPVRASRGASALRWQTAIAAGIAAVATVVAALIATSGGGGGGGDKAAGDAKPAVTTTAVRPSVSFTSWSEKPAPPKGKEYEFEGSVSELPEGFTLHVVIEVPSYGPAPLDGTAEVVGSEWMVSPAADVLRNGSWKVVWRVEHPPAGARWVVVVLGNCPGTCSAGSAAMGGLKADGPGDPDVVATATAPPESPGLQRG